MAQEMTVMVKSLPKLTEARRYRLERGIPLMAAAMFSGMSLSRASLIERQPGLAKPGEIRRLRDGVDQAYASQTTGEADED
jgi:hypothetical protein